MSTSPRVKEEIASFRNFINNLNWLFIGLVFGVIGNLWAERIASFLVVRFGEPFYTLGLLLITALASVLVLLLVTLKFANVGQAFSESIKKNEDLS